MSDDSAGHWSRALPVVLAAIVAVVVATTVVLPAMGALEPYYEASEEWCEERNGTLVNVLALGHHGGLHCELPNGTTVHMNEVIESDATR